MRFGIPVFGTAAHSWTMSFDSEEQSFRTLQQLLGEGTVFLVDTYDTLEGARLAARLGRPLWGVRLDSGDLVDLSRKVRRILDDAGLKDAKIFVTNDLNEYRVAELLNAGAPIDAFGIGTHLATSYDAPTLSVVYKLVEFKREDGIQYTAKFSGEKSTLPAAKQIYRYPDCDVVSLYNECNSALKGEPLVRPVICRGELVEKLPPISKIREAAKSRMAALPERLHSLDESTPYEVKISPRLLELAEAVRHERQTISL